MSANINAFEEKYAGESPQDRAARMRRYDLAFERCDQAYQEYMATLDTQVGRYRREAFAHAEITDRSRDEGILDRIASFFHTETA